MKWVYLAVLIFYIISMIGFSAIPNVGKVVSFSVNDKVLHFFGFFILTILVWKVLFEFKVTWKKTILIVVVNFISIFIEIMQSFIPGRSLSGYDVLANLVGFFLAWGIILLFHKKN